MDTNLVLAYVLIGAGFLMSAAELFLPTGGVLTGLSLAAFAVGVSLAFYVDTQTGLFTLMGLVVILPIVGGFLMQLWPKTPIGRRMILNPDALTDATIGSTPESLELERLLGRFGRTASSLRPSGVTNFDGKRVDTITEGLMVDPGQWVQCVAVRGGKVVVRPVDAPDVNKLETADFS